MFPATKGYTYFFKHPCILAFSLEIYDPYYFMKVPTGTSDSPFIPLSFSLGKCNHAYWVS